MAYRATYADDAAKAAPAVGLCDTVSIDNASQIFLAARHPRSFVALEGSDHLLIAPGQARRAARIISAWADQYLVS